MIRPAFLTLVATLGFTGFALAIDTSKLPPAASKQGLTFDKDIHPILEASCIRCHGAERPKAGLRLTSLESVLKGSKEGKVVIPGESLKSSLLIAVSQLDPHMSMPPKPRGPGRKGGGQPGAGGPPPGGPASGQNPSAGPGPAAQSPAPPPPKPLTPEQVGVVRAWIDQGAK
jgi:hypothetical protein